LVKEQVRDIHDLTSVWSGERVKAATAKPDAKGGKRPLPNSFSLAGDRPFTE
jgi:hypothetical protein